MDDFEVKEVSVIIQNADGTEVEHGMALYSHAVFGGDTQLPPLTIL